jgi:hypothetical protein
MEHPHPNVLPHEQQPEDHFTPDQWMRTKITALWTSTMRKQRNTKQHGTDSALTLEQRREEAVTNAEKSITQFLITSPQEWMVSSSTWA